jgi:hypothetical protein
MDTIIGFVNTKDPNPLLTEEKWFITFEGVLFIRNGGYVQQKIDKDLASNIQRSNERLTVLYSKYLNRATWWLVGVTLLLVVVGIFQAFVSYNQLKASNNNQPVSNGNSLHSHCDSPK